MTFNQQEFQRIKDRFRELRGKQEHLSSELKREESNREGWDKRYNGSLKARLIIQRVAEGVQKNLEERVSNLVSMALQVVFPDDPYKFQLEFVQRRSKTECDVWFVKRGKKMHPMACSGGGPKDVASFAARLAFWSLKKDSRPVIIADEPFKFLHSPVYQDNCSEMINELSKRLGIQMIIVSDQNDIKGDKMIDIKSLVG